MQRRFIQCDVFSPAPVRGNGLAVVVDGDGLDDAQMQAFAAWTNLAESTFILPPTDPRADYQLRIFAPGREMLFAGHPTLGSCAAWLHCGGVPREAGIVRQQCAVGIVDIAVGDDGLLEFTAPPTQIRPLGAEDFARVVSALELPAECVLQTAELENGPQWQVFELDSAETVLGLDSRRVAWPEFRGLGFFGARAAGDECDYEVRMFPTSSGMSEDPATGSLNSALGHWLLAQDRVGQRLTMAQGTAIGRSGRISIRALDALNVAVGGQVHILIDGSIELQG